MNAFITDIKRFAVHDGNGIRTTVFFKGCSLKCLWCHNPENISFFRENAYFEHKCANCGTCISICGNGCQKLVGNRHVYDRENCTLCGRCVENCRNEALVSYGKSIPTEEIFATVIEDKPFFDSTEGGITLSGGECLLQSGACRELLTMAKGNGINTAVDTCGMISRKSIDEVIDVTDTFLYDIKAISSEVHMRCTGFDNGIILDNLKYIDGKGKKTEIRIPYIPDFNDGEIKKIAVFISDLKNVSGVRVLPYHNYSSSKYIALGMKNTMPKRIPTDEEIKNTYDTLKKYNIKTLGEKQ